MSDRTYKIDMDLNQTLAQMGALYRAWEKQTGVEQLNKDATYKVVQQFGKYIFHLQKMVVQLREGVTATHSYNQKTKQTTVTIKDNTKAIEAQRQKTLEAAAAKAEQAKQEKKLREAQARAAREAKAAGDTRRWLVQQEMKAQKDYENSLKRTHAAHVKATSTAVKNTKQVVSQTKKADDHAKQLLLTWKSIARLFAVQLAHQAVSAVVNKLKEALDVSVELEKRLAEIQTIQGTERSAQLSTSQWREAIKSLSDLGGLDILDVAEAGYQTLSNQIGNAAESIYFLNEAMKFSVTTNADLTQSVALGTSILNAYGASALESERIFSQLFETIRLGRVRAEELAPIMGRVAVTGKQLGVSLTELTSMISLISIQGTRVPETLTQIRGIMLKLIKPTKQMKDLFFEWGVSSGEAAIATYGFEGVMKKLSERTKGLPEEVAKYINRIRGLSGALIVVRNQVTEYTEEVKKMEKAYESADVYIKHQATTLDNAGKNYERMINKIKNYFVVDLAGEGLRALNKLTGGFENTATQVIGLIKALAALGAILATGAIGIWIASLGLAGAAIGTVALAVAGLTYALNDLESKQNENAKTIKILNQEYEKKVDLLKEEANAARTAHDELIIQQRAERQSIANTRAEYNKYLKDLATNAAATADIFKVAYGKMKASVKSAISDIEKEVDKVKTVLEKNTEALRQLQGTDDRLFSWELGGLTDEEKYKKISAEILKIENELRDLATVDTYKQFEDSVKTIKGYYDDLHALELKNKDVKNDYTNFLTYEERLREDINSEAGRLQEIHKDELLHQTELLDTLNSQYELIKEFGKNGLKVLEAFKDDTAVQEYLDSLNLAYKTLGDMGEELLEQPKLVEDATKQMVESLAYSTQYVLSDFRAKLNLDILNAQKAESEQRLRDLESYHAAEMNLLKIRLDYAKAILRTTELSVAQTHLGNLSIGEFASGGMPRGTDTIPAMLSPNEFVMKASSTRKWLPQLMAMNDNRPVYRAEGGVSVGDIHVHPNATGNNQMDIMAIGRGLKQAIRRKQLTLATK
jgi:TP901 family phage tail tape measure protein